MMIYRVGHMDESVRTAFPSASDAQIAHRHSFTRS